MNTALVFVTFLALLWASVVSTIAIFLHHSHKVELGSINKIGKWYQDRVGDLEEENRNLAYQVISTGSPMPHPGIRPEVDPYAGKEFAYDDTGLVREVLDPRDLPLRSVS